MKWKYLQLDFHAVMLKLESVADIKETLCQFDWLELPIIDIGMSRAGGLLRDQVQTRCRYENTLDDDTVVQWVRFEQFDTNAQRLSAGVGHPLNDVKKSINTVYDRWEWCRGHLLVLESVRLYVGRIDQLGSGGHLAETIVLPAIESVGMLRSSPLKSDNYAPGLVGLWYQDAFGMDEAILPQIQRIDWKKRALSYGY